MSEYVDKLMSGLNEDEQLMVQQILAEYSTKGKSNKLNQLYAEDFIEVPVDIDTFIESPEYAGWFTENGKKIFPYWREKLREVFDDSKGYSEIVLGGSIGCGKSTIAVIGLAYTLYWTMCLKDPNPYFGLGRGDTIYVVFFNATLTLSKGVGYKKFQSLLQHSPWFMERGSVMGKKYLEYVPNKTENASIEFTVGSQPEHALGKAILCLDGDTKIYTEQGIKTLKSLSGSKTRVLTKYDDGSIRFTQQPVEILQTGLVTELLEIELEDGTILRCTEDHLFRLTNGEYKKAKDLSEEDDIDSDVTSRVHSITKLKVEPTPVYDVINVPDTHNFLVKTESGYIVSHNCGLLDEVNFTKGSSIEIEKSKIMETYTAVLTRIKSRFIVDGKVRGRLFLVSSKKTEYDFLESYVKKQQGKPGVFVAEARLYELKAQAFTHGKFRVAVGGSNLPSRIIPDDEDSETYLAQGYSIEEVPVEFKQDFEMSMDRALMDICGISVSKVTRFMAYPQIEKCIIPQKNPFKSNILTIGMHDNLKYQDFLEPELVPPEIYSKPIFIHFDCSLTGDRTGISAVAVLGYTNRNGYDEFSGEHVEVRELAYRQIFTVGIQCPKGSEISFRKDREFVYYLKHELGWNIKGISLDSFQSADMKQSFITAGFEDSTIVSLDRKPDGYLTFRTAINERRVQLLSGQNELITELVNLKQDNQTGKVDHPPEGSKDQADSLAGALYNASLHDGQFAFHLVDDALLFSSVNEVQTDEPSDLVNGLLSSPANAVVNRIKDNESDKKESESSLFAKDSLNGFIVW